MTHENKFGLFIHWGVYALTELHEQVYARYDIPRESYEDLYKNFNPINFDPEEWVLMAKEAGMKYICFTAKHHDGFCMWDTKYTDYNIMNTPYGKDVLKMLADACKKHGMLLSIYYSNPDWYHPYGYNPMSSHQGKAVNKENPNMEIYKEYLKNQVEELMTNYGKIYTLFWDIPPHMEDKSINAMVRELQPGIYINDRGYDEGDFSTPEREYTPDDGRSRFTRMTEACNSIDAISWGYRKNANFYSMKYLLSAIDKMMAKGGSYLLNLGPMADGSFDQTHIAQLKKIGDWYTRMEGCLEEHEDDPFPYEFLNGDECIITKKAEKTYFHFYNGLSMNSVFLKTYPNMPKKVRLMNTKETLPLEMEIVPDDKTGVFIQHEYLWIHDIMVDELANEPIVLEIEW